MTLYDAKGRSQHALPENASQETGGNLDKLAANVPTQQEVLLLILIEMRVQTALMCEAFNLSPEEVADLRRDPTLLDR